jgi:hypothetical protein
MPVKADRYPGERMRDETGGASQALRGDTRSQHPAIEVPYNIFDLQLPRGQVSIG